MSQFLFRQYNLGHRFGALKMQGARAMFYVGLPQTPLIAIAAAPQIQKVAPWLSVWMILLGFVLYFVIVGMWLDYKLMILSENSYNNRQAYKAENPYVEDVKEIKERLTSIEERLK
jgi:hypothetical protein